MTQDEKYLLLRDLCARLPYSVKMYLEDFPNATLVGVVNGGIILHSDKYDYTYTYDIPWNIEYAKPYLFPLSSMTEEQQKEFDKVIELELKAISDEIDPTQVTAFEVDYYNKHHFDWRGLIPMGLAKDATGLNIY